MAHKTTIADEDCPPTAAEPASGGVYRCAKSNPVSKNGMQTAEETGRLPNADSCLRRALSVFRDKQDAEHQVRLFRRWKKKFVTKATLNEQHGKTMPTSGKQPTHTSWWPAEALDLAGRTALFSIVAEVQT